MRAYGRHVDHRSEARDFPTTRRARLTPNEAGVADDGTPRRVPGLRRREVADLAGVSIEYYTRLERGNLAGVSESVLDAVARALHLDEAERMHLFDLARSAQGGTRRSRPRRAVTVRPEVASVAEVVARVEDVRVFSTPVRGFELGCHVAVEDASGDSAILEPEADGGRPRILVHHGPEHTVMANSPLYDDQLANRARYRPFGGPLGPPGEISSLDRFVRASYYRHYLPTPATADHALAGVAQVADTVTVPVGAPYDDDGVYPTWCRSAVDLTNGTYYFWGTASPAAIWLDLEPAFASAAPAGTRRIDPQQPQLVGEISDALEPATLPF